MKKFLKLQAKKSMSLFLAVLMLMSCWVWVAPEKAAAADQHDGYYYVEVRGNLDDTCPNDRVAKNIWTIKHGSTTTQLTANPDVRLDGNADNSGNYVHASGWVAGFPTGIKHEFGITNNSCGKNDDEQWGVRNVVVYIKNFNTGEFKPITEANGGYTAANGSYEDGQITNFNSTSTFAPYAETVSSSAAVESNTLEVKEFGAGDVSVSFAKGGVYDQYGVKIAEVDEYKLYADNDGSTNVYTKDDNGVWVSGTKVYASPDAQKGIPNRSGSAKIYLFGEGSGIKGCLAEITLNYPDYTVKVDPDGSITGLGASMDMSDNSPQTGTWTATGPYSYTADKYPIGTASKTGYTFKGFWSVKQPTTGDAGINADEATFAEPVDTATFNTYKAQAGATVDGSYVTLSDGKKYYNAGAQWDNAHKEIQGNDTFYGWWVPQDIVVKFYDIDGTYLGTKKAKYGSTQAADWYLNPKNGYNAGAFEYKTFAGKWRDITGIEVVEGSYKFGALSTLTLTPIYTTKTYKDKYNVSFIDPSNGSNLTAYSKEYTYRDVLAGTQIPSGLATFGTLANDPGYTYEFSGWTSLKPASGNYHTLAVGDTTITENTDWVVREDITYYAVYRSTVKEYLVAFNYIDSTGANKTETLTVPYGSAIATPAVVNRTYATGGYGYTLAGWTYKNGANASVTLDADGTIVFNNTNVFVTTNNIAPNGTAIVFTAAYGEGQPTPYTVTFKYKDKEGNAKTITGEVYHGYKITQDLVDELAIVPDKYDDGTAEYKFSNLWKVTEGTAGKAEYTKDEFTSFSPVSHVTFEALYGEGTPFYTVKYIDGANTYSERVLAGSNIPAWVVDGEEYVPGKADSETGEYTFAGWFDAAQTDKDFAETNGNEYTLESVVTGDLTLYSQYTFSPFTYTVKFVNDDGTVLVEDKFVAGASFKDIFDKAETKAMKPADEIYSYNFIGWDNPLGNYTCEGKDMTFTAKYRPSYIAYKARWYKDEASMKDAILEFESVGSDGLLAITSHTYNGKVYAPSVALTAPEGQVFDKWMYMKDGEPTEYVRGMAITDGMSFYATYKDAPVTYTLTTIVNGNESKYELAAGSTAEVAGTPVDGYVDENNHNKFIGWYTADNKKIELNTEITADITITAKFEVSAHVMDQKQFILAPSYYHVGAEYVWCACSKEDTIEKDENGAYVATEIPVLTDTVAPTGTIYLGGNGWSSTDKTGAAATDDDPVTIYANKNTDIILTINDTGDVGPYNTSGVGKGIAIIQGIISTGVFGADTTEIAGIKTIFSDSSETLNNVANYVISLGSYDGLKDGETYIAYYYVKDKAGNVLNKNVRTAKFIYDVTAPEITIAGDNDGNEKVPTYCGSAIIKGIENEATLEINGNPVELTVAGASGTISYAIKEAGNYLIKVTDKAGNSTTKKITVTAGHNEVVTSQEVTCTEDGYYKIACAVCNKTIKYEETASEDHKYVEKVIAPTCTEDGYTVNTCSVCGDEVKSAETPKLDHVDQGTYTEVTKVATCSVKGVMTTYCKACHAVMDTEEIGYDTENGHVYGAPKVLKPTCTEEGKKYKQCKYCYVEKTIETIAPLNHEGAGTYTAITTEATCYSKGVETTYCKVCDEALSTKEIDEIAHTLQLVEYDTYKQYECQVEGCIHTEGRVDINVTVEEYTVTFKGAGENGADLTFTKKVGEAIAKGAVADQTKASDNENNYTFAGWKGTDDEIVKLPIKVEKSETYTAEFTATTRIYTHTFKVSEEADAEVLITNIGKYNSTSRKPAVEPTKDATSTVIYEFDYWANAADSTKKEVTDFTITGDATFIPVFKKTNIKFNAVFYDADKSFLWSMSGPTGTTVIYGNVENDKLVVPTKDYDAENHYTFKGWKYGDRSDIAIKDPITTIGTENIRIYASYKTEKHEFKVVEDATKTWAATCTKAGQTTEMCSCGYERVTAVPMADHNYVLQEDGSKVCSVCDDSIAADAKIVTIKFMDGDKVIGTKEVAEGDTFEFTAPVKDADVANTYSFFKWYTSDKVTVASEEATLEGVAGSEDATYYVVYTSTTRKYSVSYYNYNNSLLQSFIKEYGEAIPAYTYFTPTKNYDKDNHYVFNAFVVREGVADTTVTGDIEFVAVFDAFEHDYEEIKTEPTCTEDGGTAKSCKCGYKYLLPGKVEPALNHKFEVISETPATLLKEGKRTVKCTACGFEKEEKIDKLAGTTIKVQVYVEKTGDIATDAVVELFYTENGEQKRYEVDANGDGVFETKDYTVDPKTGFVSVTVPKDYSGWRAIIRYTGGSYNDTVVTGDTVNVFGKTVEDDSNDSNNSENDGCKCSCHKNTFWGAIFRLFQKIVKLFAGKAKCCSDPDSRI